SSCPRAAVAGPRRTGRGGGERRGEFGGNRQRGPPMDKIRILIVDDAVVVRQVVGKALNADPALEVGATAADGRRALDRLAECHPDVILLDLEMPGMDGLQTLAAIRQADPDVAVVMFSRHTQRGVEATVNALMQGANDYVPKPGDGLQVTE